MSYETFAYYYDSLMEQQFYDDYLDFILKHASFDTVLELGCGTGEIAIRLAKKGKMVCATDLSDDMLEVAKHKSIDQNVSFPLVRIDMTDFQTDQNVDLVLCLCDSLNYVLEKEDVIKAFENVYDSLQPNGCFIFDIDSMYKMETILKDYKEEIDDPDFYFKWEVTHLDKGFVKHLVEINDKENNESVLEEHFQKTLDVKEYEDMLTQCGFVNISKYSDFENYHDDCERVIFVCHKGE